MTDDKTPETPEPEKQKPEGEPAEPSFSDRMSNIREGLKEQMQKNWAAAFKARAEKVERETTRILGDSDIDREGAQLLRDHHAQKYKSALAGDDLPGAQEALVQVKSHDEALEQLNKPKDDAGRMKFQDKLAARAEQDRGKLGR